ncbi:helix-turn-helix domain-containing protein [Nannocystis bainbridge]|jgi:transcriptional regulator with XRE-family HTH domain|uniref:Helix-turn-helix transcriptional regulator n=1 Tax=Nannocystis bainbridge TaxID=2995303 RepID=A0ABT5E1F1_9BACT|nr:helix-turn-helix transcriptional regulator [Nannocystis bainbridge]MDC0718546.1 helix-turn-helix transcriptional regulator [Nannocystis bainbridge]
MNEVAQEIGRRIRLWRTATPPPKTRRKREGETGWRPHLTIEELAKQTGLTVTTVNKLELGYKAPRIESLLLLAQAFGCEPTDLLPRTKAKSGPKGELLDELYAVSAQLSPKQIRDLVKVARTLEGG